MALVAYDSSDDNDSDQDEDSAGVVEDLRSVQNHSSKKATTLVHVHEPEVQARHGSFSTPSLDEEDDDGADELVGSRPSLFHNIPLPKPRAPTHFHQETEETDDVVVNSKARFSSQVDEVDVRPHRPLPSSSTRTKLSLSLPAPKGPGKPPHETETEGDNSIPRKKEGKSVKITVPAMSTFESDEEEEVPAKKKIKQSPGLSGLFAVLPPPKNSVTKVMNRSLIPHTLTKKPASSSSATAEPKMLSQKKEPLPVPSRFKPNESEDDDDDEDDELKQDGALNFFSLKDKGDAVDIASMDNEVQATSSIAVSGAHESQKYSTTLTQNVPWLPTHPEIAQSHTEDASGSNSQEEAAAAYDYSEQNVQDDLADEFSNSNQEGLLVGLPESALRELQGKKRSRGQEDINIIDVSQDDQLPKSEEWLTKGLTEERASYSHRKKTHMPTSQQRRKHQITYLAFQAKERELELKNQWAQNRLTKRQTQSKYGF